jgi:hypothetical protein
MKNILPEKEYKILKKLNTPAKIQDFLDTMPRNFEEHGETYYSPMTVLKKRTCHCAEGAILAALAFRVNGHPPLLLDLTANNQDLDHVVALFRQNGCWGAVSKTNQAVLRYREPIYRSLRELAMSYFHEYYDDFGRKNLISYSLPVNLKRFDKFNWMTTAGEIGYILDYLAEVKHFPLLNSRQIKNLRLADPIEIVAGNLVEWRQDGSRATNFKKNNK